MGKGKKAGYQHFYTPAKRMFLEIWWNQPVCPSVCVSVYVQNISFCQSTGAGIKSHLFTVLVSLSHNDFISLLPRGCYISKLCGRRLTYQTVQGLSRALGRKALQNIYYYTAKKFLVIWLTCREHIYHVPCQKQHKASFPFECPVNITTLATQHPKWRR